jgi:ABC-type branched-subunit amino acid transport system ATPase component
MVAARGGTLVSLRGVRKQFATVTAVDDVSLDIPAGGVFARSDPTGRARRRACGCSSA